MRSNIAVVGAASVSLCVSALGVEAKLIRYEIDGQQYSYSTNNLQQTREARQRIEAAKAAQAAKARAETEAAANPLARLFGSPAQREASEAQARVQQAVPSRQPAPTAQAMAPQPQAEVASTNSLGVPRVERRRFEKRSAPRAMRQANLGRPDKGEAEREKAGNLSAARDEVKQAEMPRPATVAPAAPFAEAPPRPPAASDAGSLADFINQVRKAPSETPRP